MSLNNLCYAFDLVVSNFTQDDIIFGNSKSEELIDLAEKKLDLFFPKSYRAFIQKVGHGGVGSFLISGVRTNDFSAISDTGVVWRNLKNRKDFQQPQHLIEIETVGEGTTYCLDTSQMNAEGECPVVAWPLGGYETTPILEIVAPDFGTFFLNLVQREIERKKEGSK